MGGRRGNVAVRGEIHGGAGELGGGITIGIPLDVPTPRRMECFDCLCPAPVRPYTCIDFEEDREEQVTFVIETRPAEDLRYYFRLDREDPEPALLAESRSQMAHVASEVAAGGQVELIRAYASPEAPERRNEALAERRAARLRDIVRGAVGPDAQVPEPYGGGELLVVGPR